MSQSPQDMLDTLLKIAREVGNVEGHACAFRDFVSGVNDQIATAEDELTRNPKSDLVMGEIMALRRLAADLGDMPEEFDAKAKAYSERFDSFVTAMRGVMDEVRGALQEKQRGNEPA